MCFGSSTLCDYALDVNETFLEKEIKQVIWPSRNIWGEKKFSSFKRLEELVKNLIIVRLKFESPEVEMTILDSRTTLSDKIANLGGTFGIWAELTGFSLLGIINLIIISIKLMFQYCR